MKKNTKTTKTTTNETPSGYPQETTPTAPSPRAIMFRISAITAAAVKKASDANRAEIFAEALRLIDQTAATYWKHNRPTTR